MPDTEKTETERIIELARGIPFGWLTTVNGEGRLVARPMSPREVTDAGELWFFAERDSRDASEIAANPKVGMTLNSGSTFVSFAGTAELVDDPAKKDELWDAAVEAWLPDGPQSPNAVLIKVTADSGEYWDTPGGRIATLISFVKAKVTGERYDGGENETVTL
ncbi:pyridoxamine 5'-phosphate oxidase family protein [Agromyces aureus]|uniref:Pyridoxamine 5'-phosphate oxidase n=1 Tax=Agromyces aureus TaxID=453304 RepID=A0A191WCI2_9MICO|nr:pyridoxamine 5'-phosphate oxidase family protein [Agromyces aureus]ANJ25971.1 pyridoxamine 5'-phosphate oxidase [Agromyces aureus]